MIAKNILKIKTPEKKIKPEIKPKKNQWVGFLKKPGFFQTLAFGDTGG